MLSLVLLIAAAPAAAPNTAAIDRSRSAFVACLKQAATAAKAPEVTADSFAGYARSHCAAQQTALVEAMVAFDVRNGASRKSAVEGADMAVDDYLETAKNNWAARLSN
ncbi:hypothetical protein OMW55_12655 [Sphingomonas sp. BN140010]|uniref:Uncharacterized protein n=1 Tax=Sphingomonas arvum TaxID=2992113 RepID=A0ABT3JHW3_9SPHN|nr:hypothetical protein [Sphingomonas sp. BN140010]MCW3798658.1 hypothetical protein [Sphingomonas sp. BN140010]